MRSASTLVVQLGHDIARIVDDVEIVAGAARHDVRAGSAVEFVVLRSADQRIVAFIAEEIIVVGAAIEFVAFAAAIELVGALEAVDVVAAAKSRQDVVAGVAEQEVVEAVAGAVNIVRTIEPEAFDISAQGVVDRRRHIVEGEGADEGIKRLNDHIAGGIDEIGIAARAALHVVVALSRRKR